MFRAHLIQSMAPFAHGSTNIKNHHYLNRRTVAAMLFSSGKTPGQGERDPIFLGLNQVLNGHVTARQMDIVDGTNGVTKECRLAYPMIVSAGSTASIASK